MEYQQKLLIATGLLAVIAIYIALTLPAEPMAPDASEAKALLLKSAGFGKGLADYSYSYGEVSDGYTTSYALISKGAEKRAAVQNPLSVKTVYLAENDTMFCISYPIGADEVCTSVKGNAEMDNYVEFIDSKFYKDGNVMKAQSSIAYLMDKGYLEVEPEMVDGTVGGVPCRTVRYVIDYTNLSLDEAARFGISSNSPRLFTLSSCIDETGMTRKSTLSYTDNDGAAHSRVLSVLTFSSSSVPAIALPEANGDAIKVLRKEREQQVNLVACHTDKQGTERDECVADLSLILKRDDLCELAGSLRDRCLVTLVPIIKDAGICPTILDLSFKDDCYIELAGAYKNESYCASIQDTAKIEHCQAAATPKNTTSSDFDIDSFLDYVDSYDRQNGSVENVTGE